MILYECTGGVGFQDELLPRLDFRTYPIGPSFEKLKLRTNLN